MKLILKVVGCVLGVVVLAVAVLVGYLTVTEYKPAETESLSIVETGVEPLDAYTDNIFTITTWNLGYGGLGANAQFVLDGGVGNGTPTEEEFSSYYQGIKDYIALSGSDIYLLQEVDVDSDRSYHTDEAAELPLVAGAASSVFAHNYKCAFVPFPLPPIGSVESGILTVSDFALESAERISLPCPFDWPVRAANLKRCMLVSRVDLPDSDADLVIVNFHLEAYDDGEGKEAQTAMLMRILEEEYAAGNYVVAGGDFNQGIAAAFDLYPVENPENWMPGVLELDTLPEGWNYVFDLSAPTCRLLDAPYDIQTTQHYVIDGFIVSPNVSVQSVETVFLEFASSDHNPVQMRFTLN